jgi:hypothetical protein
MDSISESASLAKTQPRPAQNSSHGPAFLFDFDGTKLKTARGADRGRLEAALDATQSRLDVLNAGLATIGQSVDFMRAFTSRETGDLAFTEIPLRFYTRRDRPRFGQTVHMRSPFHGC